MTAESCIIISFIILVVIAAIIFLVSSIKSRNTYLKYLEANLPTVAENIINDIIEKKITINDIFLWYNNIRNREITEDFFIVVINYIKDDIEKYIINYIDQNIRNKFVAKLLKDVVKLDPTIISNAIDTILSSSTKKGKEIYNKLLDVIDDHTKDVIEKINKEEEQAVKVAEAYENENIAGVEYNGEFDKSEYEIGRENDVEQEYPDEENLDDIPEELVEVIEGSETEEIILDDASDDEELVEEEFEEEEIIEDSANKL